MNTDATYHGFIQILVKNTGYSFNDSEKKAERYRFFEYEGESVIVEDVTDKVEE